MKKICILLVLILVFLVACSTDNSQNVTSTESEKWITPSPFKSTEEVESYIEYYKKNKQVDNGYTSPRVDKFLYAFRLEYAWFDLPEVYRFNYYGNSRVAVLWEHTEAIFNCSIIDDEELIKRLKEEGYKEVKTFNNEVKFAWREFEDDFVEPIYFEQKYVAEDITYGSKTYYNKVVICKPFNNSDARANEMVVFFDICCNNRSMYYDEVTETIDGRPVCEMLNSVKEWGLIEVKRPSTE